MAKPLITRETIYLAALELLQSRGSQALTARNLAAHLRCSTRTLYQQVGKREALIAQLVDYHLATLPLELDPAATWQHNASAWAATLRNALCDHPDLYRLITAEHRAPIANYVNTLFKALRHAGFNEALALRSCRTLANVTITLTLSELKTPPSAQRATARRGTRAAPGGAPATSAVIARADASASLAEFEQTISWLIAGIEADHART